MGFQSYLRNRRSYRHFKFRVLINSEECIDYRRGGYVQGNAKYKFWDICDSILETVHDRDI